MRAAALGAAFVTMALVLTSRTSAAQGRTSSAPVADSEAVSLLYEDSPPPNCPKQAEFEAEVIRLTTKAHFTQQRGARRVRIELASRGRDVVGRLISGDGKNQASREVRGKDCREVSSALAIAVALLSTHTAGAPVVDRKGTYLGFINEFDLMRTLEAGKDLATLTAEQIMRKDRLVVTAATKIADAFKMMEAHHVLSLPIEKNGVVGYSVTRHDLLRAWIGLGVGMGLEA